MKKIFKVFIALLVFSSSTIYGQQFSAQSSSNEGKIRINLYGSYAFEDSFDSYYNYGSYYQGKVQGGFLWGGGLEFNVHDNVSLELSYLRESTTAPIQYYGNAGIYATTTKADVDMNYILLGGTRSFRKPGSIVEGFGGLMAGVSIINADDQNSSRSENLTKFAWGLKGGAIIWATKKVGVKLQAQLLSVAQSVGGGVYFGTGGTGAGVSTYSSIYQFTLGGGLVFELGK